MRKAQGIPEHWNSFEEMDEVDKKLMLLMYHDPRVREQELASKLGISRQSVHRRMLDLSRLGVFKAVKASLSSDYIGGVAIDIWGRSRSDSIGEVLDRLGESELTGNVLVAGGGVLYVGGYLKDISELDGYVEFVKRAADIPEATVAFPGLGDGINLDYYDGVKLKPNCRDVSPLDLRIIGLLVDDARRPVGEIAQSLGVSPKTVRRRIERMKSDGAIDYSFPADISMGEDINIIFQVRLRSGADKVKLARRLYSIDPQHVDLVRGYSNIPELLYGYISSDKMSDIRKILAEFTSDQDVLAMVPNTVFLERQYPTWNRRLTQEIVRAAEKARKRRTRSVLGR
jgi:DNA-binding Lrp family transcriptional regulator